MIMIQDFFMYVVGNLRRRKLRSGLTIIGIFIGIAAVVSLISLGQGLQIAIEEQFQQLGTDKITVMEKAGTLVSPAASAISTNPITTKDVDVIKSVRGVKMVAPMLIKSVDVEFKNERKNIILHGMPQDETKEMFKDMTSYQIIIGKDIESKDKYKVVLGYSVAYDIFKKDVSVGDKLIISEGEFRVAGILKKIGSPLDDQSIYINLDVLRDVSNEPKLVSTIIAQVKEAENVKSIANNIEENLRKARNEKEGEEFFIVTTSEELLQTVGNILGIISAVLIGIATISLLVGGIGIMNTMYTSVLERTREIGIMKAVGAKNSHILMIFLMESGMLGLIGGVVGIILGIGISKSVEYVALQQLGTPLLKAAITPELIIGALLFSFIVGSVSGLMPARNASQLQPVEALRYE